MKKLAVAVLVLSCSADFVLGQDLAGPRSWFLDFTEDPFTIVDPDFPDSPAWMNERTSPPILDTVAGTATFPSDISYAIYDSADHFFEDDTHIHIKMDQHPMFGVSQDGGAGYWLNVDNDANQGGTYGHWMVLETNDLFEQQVTFRAESGALEPPCGDECVVPVGPGGIELFVTVEPNEAETHLDVEYKIVDGLDANGERTENSLTSASRRALSQVSGLPCSIPRVAMALFANSPCEIRRRRHRWV